MLRKLRLVGVLFLLPILGLAGYIGGIDHAMAAPVEQAAAKSFTVYNGHEVFTETGQKSTWQANRYYPESVTINSGDTVMFKHHSGVNPHTASLLGPDNKFPDFVLPPAGAPPAGGPPKLEANPVVLFKQGGETYDGSALVSSGALASDIPGPTFYNLAFTKPGTYTVLCFVHSGQAPDGTLVGMQVKVTVQAAGSAYPKTPEQVDAEAMAQMEADEKEAMASEPEAKKQAVTDRPGPNGTMIHHVNSGYDKNVGQFGSLEYVRFSLSDMTIGIGDTVEWSSASPSSFHNVLFGAEPEIFNIEPQPSGPPKAFVSPEIFLPMGSNTYSGSGVYSSGVLTGPQGPPFQGAVTNYSLTFSQIGRFEYVCGLHYHNGMDGHINVLANRTSSATPGMPSTGSRDNWALQVLAATLALVLTFAGLAMHTRNSNNSVS